MVSFALLLLILEATGVTFLRLWILMGISILLAIVFGILAARVRVAELILIPIVDVLEAIPVISFFPIVLVFFLKDVGGPLGTELAVDVLIITALVWNIIIGVYQAVSHIPQELLESTYAFKMTLWKRLRYLYLPSSYQKIVANIMPSFASGLFYITLAEVIQLGSQDYHVFGIGQVAVQLANRQDLVGTIVLILVMIVMIVLNSRFIINPLIRMTERYTFESEVGTQGQKRARRKSELVTTISQRTAQVATSVTQLVSSVSRLTSRLPPMGSRGRKLRSSSRALNIVVGSSLILILVVAVYLIAQSGFAAAFSSYVIKPSFLIAASIGTGYDLIRIVLVYTFSLLTMVPLAILAGKKGKEGDIVNSSMQVLYSVPAPIFYPLILVYLTPFLMRAFTYEFTLNVEVLIITYLSAASYIFFNVFGAARSIPSDFEMVATTLKLSRIKKLRYLTIPAVIPALITGSMSAIGSYWAGLMVAEYQKLPSGTYTVTFGLMKMIDEAIASGNLLLTDAIDIFMIIVIIIISYVIWIRLFDYSRRRFTFT
ncbi:MAG: ABC transporter permease subunit [Thermoplasmatales archaeon]|jgi:NitT/TauT family transport system permease protein|nr:ABC transporter permease subunit [Candidatus Thermoplasmatota archaeon]MCL6002375.1 ABC transporter permease subunit [Candidatus Thermoplasmatota archaeon]MDA8056314.1 ABC transporter permease subunit [Thermoplasmatales archaeon]